MLPWSSAVMHRAAKHLSCWMHTFPAEVKQDDVLPSRFSSHSINLLNILQQNSSVEEWVFNTEESVLFYKDVRQQTDIKQMASEAPCFNRLKTIQLIISKKRILNKVPSNRNTHKIRLWQRCHQRLVGTQSCISARSNGSLLTNSVFAATL